ncbi:Vga family ABC-F type ribosomal protection protein [Gracilibacillus alcaliphilus]|uniref:Vga family ABC-F type ribosomal protection protein n=1 Tax=Gracilibacillus alcaliphilus TaxID=1401441 RepID=UPI00195EC797|nr:ABC-F type ribosomal protection protein [Gracilibacillus alcaliphilus]MBM7677751.1 pleuromutilin/lincosamide/streptogramin A transport system ATP-binding/permease protein [Gracilibacillus alcaliphilus]
MLLSAHDLTVSVADRTLVEVEQLEIHAGDHIGLIGKNGTGKTTLLNVLANEKKPEEGEIISYTSIDFIHQLKEQIAAKSGGEITQQHIQQAFATRAELLFADEPTTHLDKEHIEWVEKKFLHWQGAFVVVSHDRAFLDRVCNKIWEIDQGELHEYSGNYQSYQEQKDLKRQAQQTEHEKYQEKKQQLEQAIIQKTERAQRATKKPSRVSNSEASIIGAKPYFAKKQKKMQKTAKALETRLDKLEKVEKPYEEKPLKMILPQQEKLSGRTIIQVENLSGYAGNKQLWKPSSFQVKAGTKLAIIGENGSGKTTLLHYLLDRKDGITVSSACQIGYFQQNLALLDTKRSILENVQEDTLQDETLVRTVLARLHFYGEQVHKKIAVLSGGERVKVSLAKILLSNSNTLILDEPTNFLDIEAMEALEKLLIEYEGTLIFVSHDRRFVEKIATATLEIKDNQLHFFAGSYQNYLEHQQQPSEPSAEQEDLLLIETKITEVLGKLSLEPNKELEEEFQRLLKKKRQLQE